MLWMNGLKKIKENSQTQNLIGQELKKYGWPTQNRRYHKKESKNLNNNFFIPKNFLSLS